MTEPDPLDAHHWAQAMADAREPMPDPPTPEENFADASWRLLNESEARSRQEFLQLRRMVLCLRAMIASRDAELDRITEELRRTQIAIGYRS